MDSVKNLKNDQRGAIMVLGLFVALSLVASLWYLIGIGDAIVFRDRGQEAADSVALSAATVHARGMNVISAINLISLALAMFYLILALIGDALLLIAAALLIGTVTAPAAPAVGNAGLRVYQFAVRYETTVLKKALPALGTASTAVAIAAPWLGTAAGAESAQHYKDSSGTFAGVAIGPSNVPVSKQSGADKAKATGTKPKTGGKGFADKGEHTTLGLPVAAEPNQTLCVRGIAYPVNMLVEAITDLVKKIPAVGGVIAAAINTFVVPIVENLAIAPAIIHCGGGLDKLGGDKQVAAAGKWIESQIDKVRKILTKIQIPVGDPDLWDANGPKKMVFANGDAHFLVLGWAVGGHHKDDSDRRVALGAKQFGGGNKDSMHAYDAQAEFFYDCGKLWNDAKCNGAPSIGILDVGYQHAIYSIRWKARLKRSMNLAEVVGRLGLEKALDYFSSGPYRDMLNKTGDPNKDADLRQGADVIKGTIRELSSRVGAGGGGNFH